MTNIGIKSCQILCPLPRMLCFLVLGILLTTHIVIAQDGVGDTAFNACMEDIYGSNLNCTANDVRVSGVADVTADGVVNEDDITFELVCDAGALNAGADCSNTPSICLDRAGKPDAGLCGDRCAFPGDTTSFSATFIVELSATERHDIGLYFATDDDSNGDGALSGQCSISTLPEIGGFSRPDGSSGNFVDLDSACKGGNCPQPEDLCGDINRQNNPVFYDLGAMGNFVTATCNDPDGDGQLNLPNCTSWRQSGANEVCLVPGDAFPGSPSKCNCDPAFQVPINVPSAVIGVTKSASTNAIQEPGEDVTFYVTVNNFGFDPNNPVTITSLVDDVHGDLNGQGTCSVPQIIAADSAYNCSFTVAVSADAVDGFETDTVEAVGHDTRGNEVRDDDSATVNFIDVMPQIDVTKTAGPDSIGEPGNNVTFTFTVYNNSAVEALTLNSLMDSMYGDMNGKGNCAVPQVIAVGGSYTCSYAGFVGAPAGSVVENVITARGSDNEGNVVEDYDAAIVTINNVPSEIQIIKTASPDNVNEPGGNVTFSMTINNLSSVDEVTIDAMYDDIFGDLDGQGDCSIPQLIAPGSSYSCSFIAFIAADAASDPGFHKNVVTAEGYDDDGDPVIDDDSATVTFKDVAPAASLSKTVSVVVATFQVEVTNDSQAEALTLTQLDDDNFGNITQVQGAIQSTTCTVPQTIPVGGSYTCSFNAEISVSPHTNTVTGDVSDNEGNLVSPSDSATVTYE